MKLPAEREFAAFIGIDWADAKHDLCLQTADFNSHSPTKTASLFHSTPRHAMHSHG
jgi:hypothetical protein